MADILPVELSMFIYENYWQRLHIDRTSYLPSQQAAIVFAHIIFYTLQFLVNSPDSFDATVHPCYY